MKKQWLDSVERFIDRNMNLEKLRTIVSQFEFHENIEDFADGVFPILEMSYKKFKDMDFDVFLRDLKKFVEEDTPKEPEDVLAPAISEFKKLYAAFDYLSGRHPRFVLVLKGGTGTAPGKVVIHSTNDFSLPPKPLSSITETGNRLKCPYADFDLRSKQIFWNDALYEDNLFPILEDVKRNMLAFLAGDPPDLALHPIPRTALKHEVDLMDYERIEFFGEMLPNKIPVADYLSEAPIKAHKKIGPYGYIFDKSGHGKLHAIVASTYPDCPKDNVLGDVTPMSIDQLPDGAVKTVLRFYRKFWFKGSEDYAAVCLGAIAKHMMSVGYKGTDIDEREAGVLQVCGAQGTYKSIFGRALSEVWGNWAGGADLNELTATFNEISKYHFLIVEEQKQSTASLKEDNQLASNVKKWCSGNAQQVNIKHIRQFDRYILMSFLFLTNEKFALTPEGIRQRRISNIYIDPGQPGFMEAVNVLKFDGKLGWAMDEFAHLDKHPEALSQFKSWLKYLAMQKPDSKTEKLIAMSNILVGRKNHRYAKSAFANEVYKRWFEQAWSAKENKPIEVKLQVRLEKHEKYYNAEDEIRNMIDDFESLMSSEASFVFKSLKWIALSKNEERLQHKILHPINEGKEIMFVMKLDDSDWDLLQGVGRGDAAKKADVDFEDSLFDGGNEL